MLAGIGCDAETIRMQARHNGRLLLLRTAMDACTVKLITASQRGQVVVMVPFLAVVIRVLPLIAALSNYRYSVFPSP